MNTFFSEFTTGKVLAAILIVVAIAAAADAANAALVARDLPTGEILLEWDAYPNALGYRIEREAAGVPTYSLDAGERTNVMDVAGLAPAYSYRLIVRTGEGGEAEIGSLAYSAPAGLPENIAAAAGRPPLLRSAIGTNLAGIAWGSGLPFVDVMKASTEWISGDESQWDNARQLDLDGNGWVHSLAPGQVARKLIMRDIGGNYPAGQYLVRYKGEGTLTFKYGATVVAQQPGEMLLQVVSSNDGIYMEVSATNPANYLRDIEITLPGGICEDDPFTHVDAAAGCGGRRFLPYADYHRSIIFNPVFASKLRGYSVLRFMDWMSTNGSQTMLWSQRTPLSWHTWSSSVPVEVMVALANRVNAHPWFTIPHLTDDAYAWEFAQLVRARLAPGLGVYAEYSNETWNWSFPQSGYMVQQGSAQGLDGTQYYAVRGEAVGRIFKDVIGRPRVIGVLGAQAANTWTAAQALNHLLRILGGPGSIDAVAIAPYFAVNADPNQAVQIAAMTVDGLFDYLRNQALPAAIADTQNFFATARAYGLHLIAYEGGQHLAGILGGENNDAMTELFNAANRDPRMKDLYLNYLAGWRQAGGELFVHYNDVGTLSKWGRWGALEYIAQAREAAPKFDALHTFMEQNPVWWSQ